MKYLIDTCVISELAKPKPYKNVLSWINSTEETDIYVSVLTFGELYKGISKLPESKRKRDLYKWVEIDLIERFENRIIYVDMKVASIWGSTQALSEQKGMVMPAIDSLIAATGLCYALTVVTRNISDMEQSGAVLLNPWTK
jgi:predicted nucleic acid-binding protein